MKCKDCGSCKKGWFPSKPYDYVCIGVKEPFMINDINKECTEYEDKRDMTGIEYVCKNFTKEGIIKQIIDSSIISPCIEDFGIETELSLNICDGNCEECWNSRVVERL